MSAFGFEFTDAVRRSLAKAREESARLHHEYVGTEHILLGLVAYDDTIAADVLERCYVEFDDIALKIELTIKRGNPSHHVGPDLPYTSRAKKVLEESMLEARERGHSVVGTGHLLLGILREEKGIAAQVLNDFGVTYDLAHRTTSEVMDAGTAEDVHPQRSGALKKVPAGKRAATLLRDLLESPEVLAVFRAHGVDTERLISDLESVG